MNATSIPVNVGNTGFMLLCASLVMLMTPGLAFFYGGLVQRKNVLTIMMQSFMSLGWTTVLWFAFGYSESFGPDWHGIIGNPATYAFLRGVTLHTMFTGNDAGIPLVVHIAYQMMFAIITPALITGAFANRVTFKAYFLFLTGLAHLRLLPVRAHALESGRHLGEVGLPRFRRRHRRARIGRLCGTGVGALRRTAPRHRQQAAQRSADRAGHRVAVVRLVRLQRRLGAARRCGYRLGVSQHRHRRIVRRDHVAARRVGPRAPAEVRRPAHRRGRRPRNDHAVRRLRFADDRSDRRHRGRRRLLLCRHAEEQLGWDDALDVWGVHGVGGFLGIVLLGVFASTLWNPNGADGLLRGNPAFLGKQFVAALVCSAWAFVFTYAMLWLINLVTRVKVDEVGRRARPRRRIFTARRPIRSASDAPRARAHHRSRASGCLPRASPATTANVASMIASRYGMQAEARARARGERPPRIPATRTTSIHSRGYGPGRSRPGDDDASDGDADDARDGKDRFVRDPPDLQRGADQEKDEHVGEQRPDVPEAIHVFRDAQRDPRPLEVSQRDPARDRREDAGELKVVGREVGAVGAQNRRGDLNPDALRLPRRRARKRKREADAEHDSARGPAPTCRA